jgi:hypothetical protein
MMLVKSKLRTGNMVSRINAWAIIGVVRYSARILDWTLGKAVRCEN